jgi:hypothetical protein
VLEAAVDAGQSLEAAIGAVCALPPILPPTPRRQLHALMTASADRSYVEAIDARAAVVLERVGVHGATTRARLARRLIEASLLDGALEAERSSLVAGLLAVLESER